MNDLKYYAEFDTDKMSSKTFLMILPIKTILKVSDMNCQMLLNIIKSI